MKLQRYVCWVGPLLLSLMLLSCGGPAATPEPTRPPPTQPPVVQPTQPPPTAPPAATKAPTQPPAVQPTHPPPTAPAPTQPVPAATAPQVSGVTSYRMHGIEREGDRNGPIHEEWTQELILQPPAIHYVMAEDGQETVEVILVGDSLWTKIMGSDWVELKQTDFSQALEGLAQSPEMQPQGDRPLEDTLVWLTGQRQLYIAKGSMTPAGQEEANGIPCKKYTVDSNYSYSATLPVAHKVTLHYTGEIWVANKSGWPTFLVSARLLEESTTDMQGQSMPETVFLEQDVTAVNPPDILIKPPQ